jgi:hypothetical protein
VPGADNRALRRRAYRIERGGMLSDMVNPPRNKDAAISLADRALEGCRQRRRTGSPMHPIEDRYPPPFHSITSSAMAISIGGVVAPSALAVERFKASRYLSGPWIGRSSGFDPLRMRST